MLLKIPCKQLSTASSWTLNRYLLNQFVNVPAPVQYTSKGNNRLKMTTIRTTLVLVLMVLGVSSETVDESYENMCRNIDCTVFNNESVFEMLQNSVTQLDAHVRSGAIRYIQHNFHELATSPNFLKLNIDDMLDVMRSDTDRNVSHAFEVDAINRWLNEAFTQSTVMEILRSNEFFETPIVHECSVNFIRDKITDDNVYEILRKAIEMDIVELRSVAIEFIKSRLSLDNIPKVLSTAESLRNAELHKAAIDFIQFKMNDTNVEFILDSLEQFQQYPDAHKAIIDFVITRLTNDGVYEVLRQSERLNIPQLRKASIDFIEQRLTNETVYEVLERDESKEFPELRKFCIDFIEARLSMDNVYDTLRRNKEIKSPELHKVIIDMIISELSDENVKDALQKSELLDNHELRKAAIDFMKLRLNPDRAYEMLRENDESLQIPELHQAAIEMLATNMTIEMAEDILNSTMQEIAELQMAAIDFIHSRLDVDNAYEIMQRYDPTHSPELHRAALEYISAIMSTDNVYDILRKAESLNIPELRKTAIDFIESRFDENNVYDILRRNESFIYPELRKSAINFIEMRLNNDNALDIFLNQETNKIPELKKAAIECIESGIMLDNVYTFLDKSESLNITELSDALLNYVQTHLNIEEAFGLLRRNVSSNLRAIAINYLINHFDEMASNEELYQLDSEVILNVFTSNKIQEAPTPIVLATAQRWLNQTFGHQNISEFLQHSNLTTVPIFAKPIIELVKYKLNTNNVYDVLQIAGQNNPDLHTVALEFMQKNLWEVSIEDKFIFLNKEDFLALVLSTNADQYEVSDVANRWIKETITHSNPVDILEEPRIMENSKLREVVLQSVSDGLNESYMFAVLDAAERLNLTGFPEATISYIETDLQRISEEGDWPVAKRVAYTQIVYDALDRSDKLNLTKLRQAAIDCIEKHCTDVCADDRFKSLSSSAMLEFIQSNDIGWSMQLGEDNEPFLFRRVYDWIQHNFDERYPLIYKIMENIRFAGMTENSLAGIQDKVNNLISNCSQVQELLDEANAYKLRRSDRALTSGCRTWTRSGTNRLYTLIADNYVANYIQINDPSTNSSDVSATKPRKDSTGNVVAYNCKMYRIGGVDGFELKPLADVYNPKTNSWRAIKQPNAIRFFAGVAVLNGRIYATGGRTKRGERLYTNSVESYNPFTNLWSNLAAMLEHRSKHQLVALGNHLYAIGGESAEHEQTRSVEKYDPASNEWTYFMPMLQERSAHAAAVLNGKIYVAGGSKNLPRSVEVFHEKADTWAYVKPMTRKRLLFSLVAFKGKLYASGSDSIDIYDPELDMWQELAPLQVGYTAYSVWINS